MNQESNNDIQHLLKSLDVPLNERTPDEIKFIHSYIKSIPFFQDMQAKSINIQANLTLRLSKIVTYLHYRKGQTVFYQGAPSDKFFIIIQGKVSVLIKKADFLTDALEKNEVQQQQLKKKAPGIGTIAYIAKMKILLHKNDSKKSVLQPVKRNSQLIQQKVREFLQVQFGENFYIDNHTHYFIEDQFQYTQVGVLGVGQIFGEMGLLSGKQRQATILCLQDCCFLVINKLDYQECLMAVQRIKIDQAITLIKNALSLEFEEVRKFYYYFTKVKYTSQNIIIEDQSPSNFAYIIKKGNVVLFKNNSQPINIAQLGASECFGLDNAVLELENNTSYYGVKVASSKATFYKISSILIMKLLSCNPKLLQNLKQTIKTRLLKQEEIFMKQNYVKKELMTNGLPQIKKNKKVIRSSAEELNKYLNRDVEQLNQERLFNLTKYNQKVMKIKKVKSFGDFYMFNILKSINSGSHIDNTIEKAKKSSIDESIVKQKMYTSGILTNCSINIKKETYLNKVDSEMHNFEMLKKLKRQEQKQKFLNL